MSSVFHDRKMNAQVVGPAGPMTSSHTLQLVAKIEECQHEPQSELRQRRLKNFYAEAKYRQVPLPALKALLQTRKRLRVAREFVAKLPPHRRAEVAKLAEAIGDNSEIFKFQPSDNVSSDIQALR